MSETVPLLGYGEKSTSLSRSAKIVLGAVGGVFAAAVLYVLVVLLPDYYIPQPVALNAIEHIGQFDCKSYSRYILIGDVHGHFREFKKLLKKAEYNPKKDYVLLLGDFITKGPDSLPLLDYLAKSDVDCIIGNHEFNVLQYYATFHNLEQPVFNFSASDASLQPPCNSKGGFNQDPEYLLAKKLQPQHVKYINKCSVLKLLGDVPFKRAGTTAPGVGVHAGLVWDVPLSAQDPLDNIEMRALLPPFYNETTSDPSTPGSKRWYKVYNEQNGKPPAEYVVYYGHDASKGLNLRTFTKGLDSGCDKGGQLSAMVITKNKKKGNGVEFTEEIVDVEC
ncbi:uncharacterized protein LODBEIA_P60860 [Lodderomyces beijingensis]|uniref:Calcineurin-like phosphoesterase domain-containing protein n=1 Tax=Lodderomyces beijingensis TaxID=1775926 RepID=A0ABP0ZUR2_9ASCO